MQISNRTNKIFKLFSFVVLSISLIAQPVVSVAAPAVADAPGNVVNSIAQTAGLAANAATGMLFASHSQKVIADEIGGDAQIQKKNSDVWEPIEEGSQVEGEDTIKTGENGRVRLTFDGKTVVYLTPNTELTVSEVSKKSGDIRTTLLNLKMGRLKAEVDKQKGESVFKVQTPTAIASVRGTVLYMGVTQTAQAVANMLTDLYVDEGVVDFAALSDALNNLMVDAFGASSISGDGTKLPLRRLTPEQRNEFIQAFDEAFEKAGNPQTEVESSGGDEEEGDDEGDDSSDGLNDKNSEQDTNGQQAIRNRRVILGLLLHSQLNRLSGVAGALNQLDVANTAIALAEGPADSGDWDLVTLMNRFDDGIVSADRLTSLDEIDMLLADSVDQVLNLNSQVLALQSLFAQALASDENGGLVSPAIQAKNLSNASLTQVNSNELETEKQYESLKALRASERNALRNRLDSILKNQTDLQDQAAVDRATDLQTGKVFTDAFGNRVRTDQYIFHEEGSSTVQFLSLTLRTGEYQPGISSFFFETRFNRNITSEDGLLRNLPWKDYLNVVTREEYASKMGIEEYLVGEEGLYRNPDFDNLPSQFIVHESQSGLTGGEGGLYPSMFIAEFANPRAGREDSDKIRFEETYSDPFEVDFGGGEYGIASLTRPTEGTMVQARTGELTHIMPYDGVDIEISTTIGGFNEDGGEIRTLKVGGVEIERFVSQTESEGSEVQGSDFGSSDFSGLADENGVNIFNDLDFDYIPANFYNRYEYADGESESWINHVLIGIFLPIDNEGNILNADTEDGSGFAIHGLRDLVNPNPDVNGGNYNLQTILMYGQEDEEGVFEEVFRIDTVITPESFTVLDSENTPSIFPHGIFDDEGEGEPLG